MLDGFKIEQAIRLFLEGIGEDPDREGLKDTPKRVAKMWQEFELASEVRTASFDDNDYNELIVVKDIPFYSFCEHHILPFFGYVHIGYIPKDNHILGLSKLPRIVEAHALKLNIQENLTSKIAEHISQLADPMGVGVVMEAEHLCMSMRGVRKPGHKTITSKLLGAFFTDSKVRSEFLSLIKFGG